MHVACMVNIRRCTLDKWAEPSGRAVRNMHSSYDCCSRTGLWLLNTAPSHDVVYISRYYSTVKNSSMVYVDCLVKWAHEVWLHFDNFSGDVEITEIIKHQYHCTSVKQNNQQTGIRIHGRKS
jgi:hypothetical protein